ncbi:TonB-dependent receptor domain-containing protein [Desulfonema magnum]|uniref:Tetratricopeptide repeat-containing protein n=1 Tax=Desulfonema magnum TaxID=45655 RepID=A0A975GP81_9BACT|nr:TonB-dependent receptor [Desulfonema magnum]QTA88557.1 Tetratricopeptide repeat-containing protein [Desulfonema magnum]
MCQGRMFIFILAILAILSGSCCPVSFAGPAEPCENWAARVVSVQGVVQVRKLNETDWKSVSLNDTFCADDMIRVGEKSRAAIVLRNETIFRLDENTTVTFSGFEGEKPLLLRIFEGAAHFFSRLQRSLTISTPYINGSVEGTEFFVKVDAEQTLLSVFEGQVRVANNAGELILRDGQAATARAGEAPVSQTLVRPRDAVHWALYYPPVMDFQPDDFEGDDESGWQDMVRMSVEFYRDGDLAGAFSMLEDVSEEEIRDARFFIYRAALLLSVGRADEAKADMEKAADIDPDDSHIFVLGAVMAVVQNQTDRAMELAEKAVDLSPESAGARIALSYAQQARFDLEGALKSLEDAVRLDPENALAWSGLAELWLSFGNLDKASVMARKAVERNSRLARTQTVWGFSYLTRMKTDAAMCVFEKAIELDQAAPLPRLGMGLAKIRQGDVKGGRREIEIAVSLDPNNALIRSYMGKAYYEEKRNRLAEDQLIIAKRIDPLDPTPWFYDAVRKQSLNRPVEALHDLQKSIELNDNRAVYRSRLLLDQDLAARGAGLARIYDQLGFQQLALAEGWKSLYADPGNHSAHEWLADAYSVLPRHEIARVSERLQAQLLQPININPVRPEMTESELYVFSGTGPADASFNEYSPLFNRNRAALQVSGVVGGNSTLGCEGVLSGVWENLSYSLGGFHYETDGIRENNDQDQDIYNVFAQMNLSHKTSIQGEYRYKDFDKGDLNLRFDPDNFKSTVREPEKTESFRFGFRHAFTPNSEVVASASYLNKDYDSKGESYQIEGEYAGDGGEARHIFRFGRSYITSGVGYFRADNELKHISSYLTDVEVTKTEIEHANFYVYSQLNYPKSFTWIVGGSADFFEDESSDLNVEQFNPKFGLIWHPIPSTTIRAAAYRALKRYLISDQTLEPTQIAGFNQFFDDMGGTEAWRYGIGLDQKFSDSVYAGAEYSERDLTTPGTIYEFAKGEMISRKAEFDLEEQLGRVYIYWTPHPWLAFSTDYLFERFKRPLEGMGPEYIHRLDTHRLAFGINFFHPSGISLRLKPTYVDQEGEFGIRGPFFEAVPGEDQFWVVDASLSYRFPKGWGIFTLEAKNLFDKSFQFQDSEPSNSSIYPESLILGRFTVAF